MKKGVLFAIVLGVAAGVGAQAQAAFPATTKDLPRFEVSSEKTDPSGIIQTRKYTVVRGSSPRIEAAINGAAVKYWSTPASREEGVENGTLFERYTAHRLADDLSAYEIVVLTLRYNAKQVPDVDNATVDDLRIIQINQK